MASSGMLRLVALARTNVSEELSASFIRMTRIGELEKTLAVTSNGHTLRRRRHSSQSILFIIETERRVTQLNYVAGRY
jgi:hypothetical protein